MNQKDVLSCSTPLKCLINTINGMESVFIHAKFTRQQSDFDMLATHLEHLIHLMHHQK